MSKLKINFDEDFDILDDVDCVYYTPAGSTESVKVDALRRAVRTSEAATSGGVYSVRDTVFTVPRCSLNTPPGLGGLFVPVGASEVFYIYDMQHIVNKTRYQCFCRRGFLQSELTDSITVKENTGGKDAHGVPYKKWISILSNHPAKVQENSNTISRQDDRNMLLREAQIYTVATRDINAGMQIEMRNGLVWNVVTVTGKGELGLLVVLDCVEARTPGV
jgi:head-tail adaptor